MRISKIQIPKWVIVTATYTAVALFVLRAILFKDTPGIAYDWGYPLYVDHSTLRQLFYMWNPNSGGGMVDIYKTSFYFDIVNLLVVRLGISNILFYKAASVILYAMAGTSIYAYLRTKSYTLAPAFLAGLFYQTSCFLLIRFTAGYFGFLLAAAFFPLILLTYEISLRQAKWFNPALVAGILASLFAFLQVQMLAFFALFGVVEVVFAILGGKPVVRRAVTLFSIIVGYVAGMFFWLVPSLHRVANIATNNAFANMAFTSRIDVLPHVFWNVLLLADHGITESIMIDVNSALTRNVILFIFLTAGSICAGLNYKRRPQVLKWGAQCLIVLPLAVGVTTPFSNSYVKIFSLPGLSLFREAYHLEFILLLAYTMLLASALEYLCTAVQAQRIILRSLPLLIGVFAIVIFNLPTFTGDLLGYFAGVSLPEGTAQARTEIQKVTNGRVYYPPGLGFWQLKNDTRKAADYTDQVANSLGVLSVVQSSSDLDAHNDSWKLRDAMTSAFMHSDSQFPILLPYLASNTVVERDDMRSLFADAVELYKRPAQVKQPWLAGTIAKKIAVYTQLRNVFAINGYKAYQFPQVAQTVYAAHTPTLICDFNQVSAKADAFFAQQPVSMRPYTSDNCNDETERAIRDSRTHLAFAEPNQIKHTAELGWAPGFLDFYSSPSFANQIEDFVSTHVPDTINFAFTKPQGVQKLAVRYFASPRGSELHIAGQAVNTKASAEGWRYLFISPEQLVGQTSLTVQSSEGDNAVGPLAWISSAPATTLPTAQLGSAQVVSQRISPTELRGEVSQLTPGPKLLIFSENFDPRWQLTISGQTLQPFKTNTYANGYLLPSTSVGTFEITFTAQKSYQRTMVISMLIMTIGALWALVTTLKIRYSGLKSY